MAKMGDGGGLAWTYTFTGPKITLSTAQWGGGTRAISPFPLPSNTFLIIKPTIAYLCSCANTFSL